MVSTVKIKCDNLSQKDWMSFLIWMLIMDEIILSIYLPSLQPNIIKMSMNFMIGLALMLVSSATFSIKVSGSLPQATRTTNLMTNLGGFPNKIGDGFGNEKASSFINFLNSASALYRDDYEQNLLYIHACMTAAYPEDGDFAIIIQGNSTSTRTGSFIYGSGTAASFSAGINLINPSWSYYAYFMDKADDRQVEYIPPLGRGAGIDDAKAEKLNQIIKKNDGIICKCNQVWLFDDLSKSDGQGWNEVCHSGPISHAYVPVRKSQWMTTRPGPCYYMIYVL